jgi:hypothetical protein
VEPIRAAAAELGLAQVEDAAEHRRDPPPRPADRVLDLRERPRAVGRLGELVEQLAHQVAAAVVEAGDLVRVDERVVRRVLPPRTFHRGALARHVRNTNRQIAGR